MKSKNIVLMLLAPFVVLHRVFASPPAGLVVSNTAGSFEGGMVSRYPTTAFTVPNLVAGKGATAGKDIAPCAATGVLPLGFVQETAAIGEWIGVQMGYSDAVLGVASAAIAADVPVYTSTGGKLSSTGGTGKYLMGRSLTAAAADGDELTIMPCPPVLQP